MRVFIAGIDGYLGWPLAQHLVEKGYEVFGADSQLRRKLVGEMGSMSAIPIASLADRLSAFYANFHVPLRFFKGDLTDYHFVSEIIREARPDAIIHLGEIPSAPYSMINIEKANQTVINNLISTQNILYAMRDLVPDCHLVKLGTMGEYGTPSMPISEGNFDVEYKGYKASIPFPRTPGSIYHLSKVHDTNAVMFACRLWGLRSTDIMQGVVYGTQTDTMKDDPRLKTRLDFDESFGTAINRFACQAVVGMPLTPYGKGKQKRGFLPLRDSIQCMTIALQNPPSKGEYRIFNQFEEVYSIYELAEKIRVVSAEMGLSVEIRNLNNPRIESEDHFYKPEHKRLLELGYKPTHDMNIELKQMLADLMPHRERIESRKYVLIPSIHWNGRRERCSYIESK